MERQEERWPGPPGMIPVTSGRADDAALHTRLYLDRIRVRMRVIDSVKPSLETTLLGRKFSSPIMMPAFSHLNKAVRDGRKPMEEYARAAAALGTLNFAGMEPDSEFEAIAKANPVTVRIIKPFADHGLIRSQIEFARDCGAFGVGVDIDHIAGKDGGYDVVDGIPMGPVMKEDLREYASMAGLPFIAKGVLSVSDALKAADAGCAGIVVSHHHGRIPFGIAPAQELPEIRSALDRIGSRMAVLADCSVDTGYDAYKLMALGADAVCAGRSILRPLLKDGQQGVEEQIRKMNAQLSELMLYTGVPDTSSFDPSVLLMC
ncbi:MAG: alpha-hydroxy-acid oxidizing protein [Succinivibrio sp.]